MLRVLGPLRVDGPNGRVDIRSDLLKTLAAFLILNSGQSIAAETLIDILWPTKAPRTAQAALRNHCASFRKLLDEGAGQSSLVTEPSTAGTRYRFSADIEDVDSLLFPQKVKRAERLRAAGKTSRAIPLFEDGIDLWTGKAFEDLDSLDFLPAAHALEVLRVSAIEQLAEAYVSVGRYDAAIAILQPILDSHRDQERITFLLMMSLYRVGQAAEALRVCKETCRFLADCVGLEPNRDLLDLELTILNSSEDVDKQPTPGLSRSGLVRRGPFVGREAILADIMEHSTGEVPTDSAVVAPAGSGKTRMLAELAAVLEARSIAVTYVRAEGTTEEPLATIQRVLKRLPFQDPAAALTYAAEVVEDIVVSDREIPHVSTDLIRIAEMIDDALELSPVRHAVFIDDAHLCDDASMRTLRAWMRQRSSDVIFILASRSEGDSPFHGVIQDASQLPLLRIFDLEVLSQEAITEWIRTVGAPANISPQVAAEEIWRASEGVPFYVEHLVREFSRGRGDRQNPLHALQSLHVPRDLQHSLNARVRRLDPMLLQLVSVGAVLGESFTGEQAIEIADQVFAVSHVPIRLDQVDGIVVSSESSAGSYTFSHSLLRTSCASLLDEHELQQVHALALQRLAETPATIVRRAHHAAAAFPTVDADKALHLLGLAGSHTLRLSAFADAALLYEKAAHIALMRPAVDHNEVLGLRIQKAAAMQHLGARAETLSEYAAVLGEALNESRPELAAECALAAADFGEILDDSDPVREMLQLAITHQPPTSAYRAKLAAELIIKRTIIEGATSELVSFHEYELGTGVQHDLEKNWSQLHLLAGTPNAESRLTLSKILLDIDGDSSRRPHLDAQLFAISALLELGHTTEAHELLVKYEAAANQSRRPGVIWLAKVAASDFAQARGNLHLADKLSTEALLYGQDHHVPDAPLSFAGHQLTTMIFRGQLADVPLGADPGGASLPLPAIAATALVLASQQQGGKAMLLLDQVLDSLEEQPPTTLRPFAIMLATEALLILGDRASCRRAEDLLSPYTSTFPRMALVGTSLGPTDRQLSLLAAKRGDGDANKLIRQAAKQCRNAQLPLWEIRCLIDDDSRSSDSQARLLQLIHDTTITMPETLANEANAAVDESRHKK